MASKGWKEVVAPIERTLAEIMSEECGGGKKSGRQKQRVDRQTKAANITTAIPLAQTTEEEWEDYSALLLENEDAAADTDKPASAASASAITAPAAASFISDDDVAKSNSAHQDQDLLIAGGGLSCDSDAIIAQLLQSQYDHEYNQGLRQIERQRNKHSKVTITLDNFMKANLESEVPYENEVDDDERSKCDWDRFETNEKLIDTIPKCGFKIDKEGEMITKHDARLCGVRNACRVMSFPPDFPTGDAAGFDMKLSNQVYNQLKTYSQRSGSNSGSAKKSKMHNRKENVATAEMGVDARTRLLLYKLINNQILEQINGIISTGKEAVILHANSDPATYTNANVVEGESAGAGVGRVILPPPHLMPKECAIKIFKTTLNEFKQRDRYIKDDYRFKDRFSKQNNRVVIDMWAEKEMHNMRRMQSVGINCPYVVALKQHVLVMSFIGDNHNAAPKLKDARLSASELSSAYEEIVEAMHKLYNQAKLVHADMSEYNILWYDDKCWFIDVAQSVEPEHPSALEFLMRDCNNIINFFNKRGLPNIYTKEQLFEHITAMNAEEHNAAMLERIHTRGACVTQATAPNMEDCPDELKPLAYPFELAWEKSQAERKTASMIEGDAAALPTLVVDQAANALQLLSIKCNGGDCRAAEENQTPNSNVLANVVTDTAKN